MRDDVFRPMRAALACSALLLSLLARAQESDLAGRLIGRDSVRGDPRRHVAAYVPSRYDPRAATPILLVLDPRGRAVLGMQLFAAAAERLGWVVISSYDSRSDSDDALNVGATNAMLTWAEDHVRMDTTRLYLAGFSGTSRYAWTLAAALHGNVAGIFGAGGAPPFSIGGPEMTFGADSSFAFFGAAGTSDFNYREMRDFDARLRAARIPSRIVWFRGPHSWPPRAQCEGALEWFELRAMVGGRRAVDSSFVSAVYARDLTRADSLEHVGQWDAAETLFREIAIEARGRREGTAALTQAEALVASDALRSLRERSRKRAEQDVVETRREFRALADAHSSPRPMAPDEQRKRLDIKGLERRLESADSVDSESAQQLLANVRVMLAFYEPRDFLAAGEPVRAAMALRAAATLGPLRGESCDLVRLAAAQVAPSERAQLPSCE